MLEFDSNQFRGSRPKLASDATAYSVAIGFVVLAAIARWALDPLLDNRVPFITFFLPVVATALVGDFRHSILSAILGLLVAWYVFVPERYSFRISDKADISGLVVFGIVSTAIAGIGGRLRAVQRRLQESEFELAEFFENATVGLHWVGPDGTILRANQADLDLVGYSHDEYVGQHISKFYADQEIIIDILRRLSDGQKLSDYPARLVCKDGSIKHVLIDSSAFFENGLFVHSRCFTRDMTDRLRTEFDSRKLAAIVESSADAIVSKDLQGIVTSWNSGAQRVFGYTSEEMIGRPIAMLIPPERINEEPSILERISRGERVEHYETIRRRKDGQLIDVSLSISPIRDASGQIIGASKIARDITERARLQSERHSLLESERVARIDAERAIRLRDEFLAMVSHELRTPLNGILGWAQLLKRGATDPTSLAEGIDAIEHGARAQAQLINDLLDMNRIIAGKLHLDIQNVHLSAVIESALATVRPAADAKGIRIQKTLATEIGTLKGDPNRLQQVVWNLVSNAVKFTPKGGTVQILLERINSHVEISVADDGIGISSDFLPHVFDRFRQADASASRHHGGLGLGLAIVKQIVELHGGSVAVDSLGEGKGSTFNVRLPVSIVRRPASLEAEFIKSDVDDAAALDGIHILVVDDDPGAADVVKRMLESTGARSLTANSGEEALGKIDHGHLDLVLSDIGMPGMDGYELIQAVRKRGNTIPAIAITAFARPEDRIRALQAGFSMHLPKPIDARELITVVEAVLRNSGRLI